MFRLTSALTRQCWSMQSALTTWQQLHSSSAVAGLAQGSCSVPCLLQCMQELGCTWDESEFIRQCGLAALLHAGLAQVDEHSMLQLLQKGGGKEDQEDSYVSDPPLVLGEVHKRRGGCRVCRYEKLAREVVCSMRTSL